MTIIIILRICFKPPKNTKSYSKNVNSSLRLALCFPVNTTRYQQWRWQTKRTSLSLTAKQHSTLILEVTEAVQTSEGFTRIPILLLVKYNPYDTKHLTLNVKREINLNYNLNSMHIIFRQRSQLLSAPIVVHVNIFLLPPPSTTKLIPSILPDPLYLILS